MIVIVYRHHISVVKNIDGVPYAENDNLKEILSKRIYNSAEDIEFAKELGKLFTKYARPAYSEICASYLQSKDSFTVSQGIDIYKNGRYETARVSIEKIARDKSSGNNGKRARKILGISDEEIEDKKDSESEKAKKEKSNDSIDSKKIENTEEASKPETVTKESSLDGK